jgi:hypothetical protein
MFAVKFLKEMEIADRVEEVVLETLPETKIGEGKTFALDLAKTYTTSASAKSAVVQPQRQR